MVSIHKWWIVGPASTEEGMDGAIPDYNTDTLQCSRCDNPSEANTLYLLSHSGFLLTCLNKLDVLCKLWPLNRNLKNSIIISIAFKDHFNFLMHPTFKNM